MLRLEGKGKDKFLYKEWDFPVPFLLSLKCPALARQIEAADEGLASLQGRSLGDTYSEGCENPHFVQFSLTGDR